MYFVYFVRFNFFPNSLNFTGRVEIGPEVEDEVALKHWKDVVASPRKQLAVWHRV